MLHPNRGQSVWQAGDVLLDEQHCQVTSATGTPALTPMECRLLKVLMLHQDQIVRRETLMKTVWKTDYVGDTRTLDVHISWLRKKIEQNPQRPRYLKTVRGYGYVFNPVEEQPL